jgi:hypothetical protein
LFHLKFLLPFTQALSKNITTKCSGSMLQTLDPIFHATSFGHSSVGLELTHKNQLELLGIKKIGLLNLDQRLPALNLAFFLCFTQEVGSFRVSLAGVSINLV